MNQPASRDFLRAPSFFQGLATAGPKDLDFALVQAAASGAKSAWGELYVRHNGRVYSLCLRMTGNVADAEDLTQEVFILLLRKIDSFRGDSLFTTWLHRLTVNHVLMHFRRAQRRLETPEGIGEELSTSFKGWHSVRPQVTDYIALDIALSQLPPGHRSVFVLYDIEGYNHEEIALRLGCSVGTSKSQLHKARKRLRRLLRFGKSKKGRYAV